MRLSLVLLLAVLLLISSALAQAPAFGRHSYGAGEEARHPITPTAGAVTTALTITTAAPAAARRMSPAGPTALALPLPLLAVGWSAGNPRRHASRLLGAIALALVLAILGCGNNTAGSKEVASGRTTTPPGHSWVSIIGTSGAFSRSGSVSLTVR